MFSYCPCSSSASSSTSRPVRYASQTQGTPVTRTTLAPNPAIQPKRQLASIRNRLCPDVLPYCSSPWRWRPSFELSSNEAWIQAWAGIHPMFPSARECPCSRLACMMHQASLLTTTTSFQRPQDTSPHRQLGGIFIWHSAELWAFKAACSEVWASSTLTPSL